MFATSLMRSAVATELPPNLYTFVNVSFSLPGSSQSSSIPSFVSALFNEDLEGEDESFKEFTHNFLSRFLRNRVERQEEEE